MCCLSKVKESTESWQQIEMGLWISVLGPHPEQQRPRTTPSWRLETRKLTSHCWQLSVALLTFDRQHTRFGFSLYFLWKLRDSLGSCRTERADTTISQPALCFFPQNQHPVAEASGTKYKSFSGCMLVLLIGGHSKITIQFQFKWMWIRGNSQFLNDPWIGELNWKWIENQA